MCVMSMVTDHYTEKWNQPPYTYWPKFEQETPTITIGQVPSAAEIAEFRKLLERAREYDKKNNEPACELQAKKDALKVIADALGIDVSFV